MHSDDIALIAIHSFILSFFPSMVIWPQSTNIENLLMYPLDRRKSLSEIQFDRVVIQRTESGPS